MYKTEFILRNHTSEKRKVIGADWFIAPLAVLIYNIGESDVVVNVEGGDSYSESGQGHSSIGYDFPVSVAPGGVRAVVLESFPRWLSFYLDEPAGDGVKIVLVGLGVREVP